MIERAHDTRVIQVVFANQEVAGMGLLVQLVNIVAELAQEVLGAEVLDGMHGIEPQPVDMEVAQPHHGILQEEMTHPVAEDVVEVDGLAPGGVILAGEARAKGVQVVALRPQVVVHHVENHGNALLMTGLYQLRELQRPPVAGLHSKGKHPVVAPVAAPREGGYGHDLYGIHAQLFEVRQLVVHGHEGPLGGERAHVQLVDHQLAQAQPPPAVDVYRADVIQVDGRGGLMHPHGLHQRGGVGKGMLAVDAEHVPVAGRHPRAGGMPDAIVQLGEVYMLLAFHLQGQFSCMRGPHHHLGPCFRMEVQSYGTAIGQIGIDIFFHVHSH